MDALSDFLSGLSETAFLQADSRIRFRELFLALSNSPSWSMVGDGIVILVDSERNFDAIVVGAVIELSDMSAGTPITIV